MTQTVLAYRYLVSAVVEHRRHVDRVAVAQRVRHGILGADAVGVEPLELRRASDPEDFLRAEGRRGAVGVGDCYFGGAVAGDEDVGGWGRAVAMVLAKRVRRVVVENSILRRSVGVAIDW